jgi:hypothetical protein
MQTSSMLFLHICGGTLGLLSGAAAAIYRKGSRGHRLAGNIFVISMLTLGGSGAYMAMMKSQPGNVLAGTLTCYLVATAWMTAKRGESETGVFDWGALLVILAVAAAELTFAYQAAASPTGKRFGYPPLPYLIFGAVAMIAASGDIRTMVRGGISGTKRLARHLWRMCFALFIASASVFLARPHLFPAIFRKSGLLVLLTVAPLILMIFWLLRVRYANAYREARAANDRIGASFAPVS